jgi:hypothetical protein
MLRIFPALIGLGLTALWIVGMCEDATVWLTWCDGIAAALAFACVGVIPDRRGSLWAGLCLGGIAGGQIVLWLVAVARHATPWLAWWTFAVALGTGLLAFAALLQGALDALRAPDVI